MAPRGNSFCAILPNEVAQRVDVWLALLRGDDFVADERGNAIAQLDELIAATRLGLDADAMQLLERASAGEN